MPAGQFYEHGLIHTYLGAGSAALFGFNMLAMRLPALLVSVPTLWSTFVYGKRWFSPRTGVLALALLALAPEAIEWRGRVRLYSLWQLFTLASVILLYQGALGNHARSARCLAIASFTGAILCHLVTLILLPPLALGLLAAYLLGRRFGSQLWIPRKIPWAEIVVLVICLGVVLLFVRLDRPGGVAALTEIQFESVLHPFRLVEEVLLGGWQFLKPPYWITTTIWLTALVGLVVRLLRREHTKQDAQLLYLSLPVILTVMILSLVTPVFARRPRYVYNLLPLYFLGVAFGLDALTKTVEQAVHGTPRNAAKWLPLVLVIPLFVGPASFAASQQKFGDKPSLEYVKSHWQAGDVIATNLTVQSEIVLGRCDYYVALSEPFIRQADNGSWTDAFLGLPWISTGQELREVVTQHPRAWLVVEGRHADVYEAVLEGWLTLMHECRGISVYLVQPEDAP
jgi:4-amino-4-deoxy-L-arabinose transferase-like glycosyltransferase